MNHILLTGGAGFIGAQLIDRLLPVCDQLIVLDNLSVGRPMPPERPGLVTIQGDIRDQDGMRHLCQLYAPQTIVHLAAIHHIPTCERDPHTATQVNVMGFQSVLDGARAGGCRQIILASSGAVYAWADGQLSEQTPLDPQDVYAASKAANEHQLAAWVAAGHGAGLIARLFNVIGPRDPNGHLIPDLLTRLRAMTGQTGQLVMGNVDRQRDFVDLSDMADGLLALLQRGWSGDGRLEAFNLCSGREHSVADLAHQLAREMGLTVQLSSRADLCRMRDRPSQWGNPAKAQQRLGWQTRHSLAHSLRTIIAATAGADAV